MTIIHSLILGLIEGLTEFLPVSSTAHLIIASSWLKIPDSEFLKTYSISIQFGAILSVFVLYLRTILKNPKLIYKIATAFIPTAIIGLSLYKLIKNYLMESLPIIALALIIGGIIMIILERNFSKNTKANTDAKLTGLENISYKQSFLIGLSQALAIIPGVSRSAASIMGGLALKISRKDIVEFSFLLAFPTILAASAYDLYKSPLVFSGTEVKLWILGFVVSFLTAILSIRYFLKFIKKNNFIPFAWYRIGLGLLVLLSLTFL